MIRILSSRGVFVTAVVGRRWLASQCPALMLLRTSHGQPQVLLRRRNTYSNFAKKPEVPRGTVIWLGFLISGMTLLLLWNPVLSAAEVEGCSSQQVESAEEEGGKKKRKVGFKERKVIEYENRIRSFSTPDKTFRYFATLKVQTEDSGDWEVFMTPADFLRAITPGEIQPDGLGLDSFRRFDPKKDKLKPRRSKTQGTLSEDSIFFKLGSCGLLAFSDYIFLLTLISTPWRYFDIAFRMFDLNGDGDVEYDEFEKVQQVLRGQTSIGQRHRNSGASTLKNTNSALAHHFFGADLKKRLTLAEFQEFHSKFMRELLQMEFNRSEPNEEGLLSEVAFAKALVSFAGLPEPKRVKMLKRVKKKFADSETGITFEEYLNFFKFLHHIADVDTALQLYTVAGAGVGRKTFARVATIAGKVELSDKMIDVIYTLFDDNGDDRLSHKEFVSIMKQRVGRGLEKPRDTGFTTFVSALWACTKQQSIARLQAAQN